MANRIQVRRGAGAGLAALTVYSGEPLWTTDGLRLYIGGAGNTKNLVGEADFVKLAGSTMTGALTLSGLPTNANHAASKEYVDSLAAGLDPKASVRLATTAALPTCTYAGSGVGKTITGDSTGVLVIDDVTVVLNDRILVKNQPIDGSAYKHNGIYKCTTAGAVGVQFVLTRATDADQDNEVSGGVFVFVEQGTENASSGFVLSGVLGAITVDTSSQTFMKFTTLITHTQNTDTGTTAATWIINSGGGVTKLGADGSGALVVKDANNILSKIWGGSFVIGDTAVQGQLTIHSGAGAGKSSFITSASTGALKSIVIPDEEGTLLLNVSTIDCGTW